MRKTLSLKKAQSSQKNQKSITQFFKNTNIATQRPESSGSTSKRKLQSPEKLNNNEEWNNPLNNSFVPNYCSQDTDNKSKKLKLEYSPEKFSACPPKKSPKKEKLEKLSSHKLNHVVNIPGKRNIEYSSKSNGYSPKNSPKKENGGKISPHKSNHVVNLFGNSNRRKSNDCSPDKSSMNENGECKSSPYNSNHVNNVIQIKKNERSPLNPVIENDNLHSNVTVPVPFVDTNVQNKYAITPTKQVMGNKENSPSPKKVVNKTPKKSPNKGVGQFEISKLTSPKLTIDELSPSKSGSTVKSLEYEQDVGDMFSDDFDIDDVDQDCPEDLDLNTMQRCEIISVTRHATRLELRLKNCQNNIGTCFIEGVWLDTPLSPGEVVSIIADRDSSQRFCVSNTSGLLSLRPDHLVSSTSVVGGVFCKRKAILQERWKGIDSANTAMTVGIIIHELVQKALTNQISDIKRLNFEADEIIKGSLQRLYDAGLSEAEARSNIQVYISPLAEFMQTYVGVRPPTGVQHTKDKWNGHVDKVLDIEENLCCPQLGLKGKIDATLQVTIHDRKNREKAIVPLELKSGKASMSAEHRGQLVLYGMMLSLQRDEHPARAAQRGLLLYLKERVELREVSCGYPERRDLMMLRNQLVQHLASSPQDIDTEQVPDIEEASLLLQQKLPEPIHHENACSKCPYLTICSLHLWHSDTLAISENHPLSKLRDTALGHLNAEHIKYFLHWTALLKIEEKGQMAVSPLHSLWTDSVEKRAKRGSCAPNLRLNSSIQSDDRHLHIFERETAHLSDNNHTKGPQEGEFSIVSIDRRPWIAAGVVIVANNKEIHILLERDLSRRLNKSTLYHIDTYESYATTVQNLTNLGVLMEDSDRALRLRKIIVDKEEPVFEKKLPREVGRLGSKLMRTLNIQQQRAVLKALAAKDYALLQGLPGTGKTQTVSVLIQMLVGLKQRVLVTAHTHSAVDNVLSRLPESMCVMRLGAEGRVSSNVAHRSENKLTKDCQTTEQLERLYDKMDVVGVTCLGAAHAMLSRTTFDVCIVDEATQVLQCTVLRPLFAANRFVLVGDPDQLPPVVRSRAARRLGMEESLFHRLMREEATSTLQLQYRMNQALVDIANKVAYNSRLKCADEKVAQAKMNFDAQRVSHLLTKTWLSKSCSLDQEYAAVFLNVPIILDSNVKSCVNETEACMVLQLVEILKEGNVKPSDIGVIAPYRDQVSLLRRSLARNSVEVSTVDQFQGRDKSVIVYSCTRHDLREDNLNKIREGEVLNDQRRLAVSVTRAKHKLIVIGNLKALTRYAPLQRLIEACTLVTLEKDEIKYVFDTYKKLIV